MTKLLGLLVTALVLAVAPTADAGRPADGGRPVVEVRGVLQRDRPVIDLRGALRFDRPVVEVRGAPATSLETPGPLAGKVIVVDPGHQLGNHNFPRQINRLVPAGGFRKPCNTTGTATNAGYPEATFTWQVARLLQKRLEGLGATVKMTRSSNRQDRWGPCVDKRGLAGNDIDADAKISIHGDGSYTAGAHGFHVIAPTDRRPWTHDIYRSSKRLAIDTRAALKARHLAVANYIAGGDGLDFRSDLATINLSDVPTVMVELGNMRNPGDARRMRSPRGRATYAAGLAAGLQAYLR